MMNSIQYCCPICSDLLKKDAQTFSCQNCDKSWPIKEDIPCFAELKAHWDFESFSQKELDELLHKAESMDWESFRLDYFQQRFPRWFKYFFDQSRADGVFLAPLSRKSRVLDLGCGWGSLSRPLSRRFDEVISVDNIFGRLKWLSIACRKEGIDNVQPVLANVSGLPFPRSYFDLILMNGLLEWVGTESSLGRPYQAQKKVLSNMSAMLKQRGYLYIGVENRFGYQYFLGDLDHSGLRFTSLMPRSIADLWSMIMTKRKYRTYTYSYKGYQRLLKEAGFDEIKFYCPLTGYHYPRWIFPFEDADTLRYFLNNIGSLSSRQKIILFFGLKLLLLSGLYKYFMPSFIILCRKK
ncbi:MAG: class I SAM-dependent methyltransferase [Candidatus Omnitrophica bacterium]|nr:class I SAM-dependent methyltransferase [Candidatus Omnitrophota bacterium]